MDLDGRRVLVTGASRGIGEAIAREAATRGARLALVARRPGPLEALAQELDATAYPADLSDPATPARLVEEVGPVDVLVNNAGLDAVGEFVATDPDAIGEIFQVNLLTPVLLCRLVLPGMLERGQGHLVNVSSLAGVAAYPGMASYASTKAGLTQFTSILRAELRGTPIGTTVVELGPIPTDMLDHVNTYAPTRNSFDRGYKLRLLVDVPRQKVAKDVVRAIEKGHGHVRHPKRALAFPLLSEAPRRLNRILLAGVKNRPD